MKTVLLFSFVGLLLLLQNVHAQSPVHQYCLEELKKDHPNNDAKVERLYSKTGESSCFELKTHVARCLDRSLYALIKATHPEQLKDKSKVPGITVEELKSALASYVNVGLLPGFEDALFKCSHKDHDTGKHVISIGDFSRKCECDFGNDQHCRAYKHVGEMMHCGNTEPLTMVF